MHIWSYSWNLSNTHRHTHLSSLYGVEAEIKAAVQHCSPPAMKFQQILKLQPNWKHIGEWAAIANKIWITDQLQSQNKTSYTYSASPNIFTSSASSASYDACACVCVCVLYESAFACSLARGGASPCPAPLCIGLMTRRNVNQTLCKHHSMYPYVY